MPLIANLETAIADACLAQDEAYRLQVYLDQLRDKDRATYEHSVRVGIICYLIADYVSLDPKHLLLDGCLHDVGKLNIDLRLLRKTEGINEEDMAEIRKHPLYGFELLREHFPSNADVVVRHHCFQKDPYPKELPEHANGLGNLVNVYARIVAIADSYDAMSTRCNDKFGAKRNLGESEVHENLLRSNSDLAAFIESLYDKHILGREKIQVR